MVIKYHPLFFGKLHNSVSNTEVLYLVLPPHYSSMGHMVMLNFKLIKSFEFFWLILTG